MPTTARSITLTNVGSGVTANYSYGKAPATLDANLGIEANGVSQLTAAKIWISSGFVKGDLLAANLTQGLSSTYNPSTGALIVYGAGTLADYQMALESVAYSTNMISTTNRALQISWLAVDKISASQSVNSAIASSRVAIPAATMFSWATAANGLWNVAANWTPALAPNGSHLTVTLGSAGSNAQNPAYTVTLASGPAPAIGVLDISDAGATLAISGGERLKIAGDDDSIIDGVINLDGVKGATGILQETSNGAIVNNSLIEGSGGASGANALLGIGTLGLVDNDDLIEAASGEFGLFGLHIKQSTTHGVIEALNQAWVGLYSTTIAGGELLQAAGGDGLSGFGFRTLAGGSGAALENVTVNANVLVAAKSVMSIEGAIAVDDVLQLDSAGSATLLVAGSASLTGAGQLLLGGGGSAGSGYNLLTASQAFSSLNNAITILASGAELMAIGGANLTLHNLASGVIEDAAGARLIINTGSHVLINDGQILADGNLSIAGHISGGGTIAIADGGRAALGGAVDSGTIEIAAQSGGAPALHGGELALSHAEMFDGAIEGLGVGSSAAFSGAVDLLNFRFGHTAITSVGGSNALDKQTLLHIADAADHLSATIELTNTYAGEYSTSNAALYHLSADGGATAGTLLTVTLAPQA